jgi:D-glycero-alpha-D-manno-heptose-7-phosphate kinase
MPLHCRAPVRFDFAGGWTDVSRFCRETQGRVLNATLGIYSYASLYPIQGVSSSASDVKMIGTAGTEVQVYSADLDIYLEAETIKELEYDGNVDLIKAALRQYPAAGGFRIVTSSNAPAGSGLGTSAAMGVALMTLISAYNGRPLIAHEAAESASFIEQHELGILGGKQDHYASAFGGFLFMEFEDEAVQVSRLKLPDDVFLTLERDLLLCYTGKSRLSGDIHKSVTEAFTSRNPETVGAIERLKEVAEEMKFALLGGDLAAFARLMNENWECQKKLHPSVTNDQIGHLFDVAYQNGALGGKAGGAGGGGCLMFYCEPEKRHAVYNAIVDAGATVINFNFDHEGVRTWQTTER